MGLLISILLGAATMEAYIWLPALSSYLLELALRRLPATYRVRCREEWQAGLNAFPNSAWKLVHAISFFTAADAISNGYLEEKFDQTEWRLKELSCLFGEVNRSVRTCTAQFIFARKALGDEIRTSIADLSTMTSIRPENLPSYRNAVIAIEEFCHTLTGAVDRSWDLLTVSLDMMNARLADIDRKLVIASKKTRQAYALRLSMWDPVERIDQVLASAQIELDEVAKTFADENWGDTETLVASQNIVSKLNKLCTGPRLVTNSSDAAENP